MITFDEYKRLLKSDRSVRRFDNSRRIPREILNSFIELCRYTASGRNAQPLKYYVAHTREDCDKIFPLLKWAGYFPEWDGPEPEEQPTAYLIQCLDTRYGENCLCDDGLQLQAITLGAASIGINACIIKAFDAHTISETLNLPEHLSPRYVLAMGYGTERVKIEDMDENEDACFKYYRTPDGVHHVPKRSLQQLIINKK